MVAANPDSPDPTTWALTDSEVEQVGPRRWRIIVADGPDAGLAIERDRGTLVIGTHESVELRLSDPAVSRYHAELSVLPEGVLIKDLGSRNGVRLSGRRVEQVVLPAGAQVRVGRTTLEVLPCAAVSSSAIGEPEAFGAFVTVDPDTKPILGQLRLVAKTEATVLIEGDTGTGKEILARALHETSNRAQHPFQIVDCSAVSPGLLESQLFGHLRGAFTGAVEHRQGAFEAAQGGTVFLDELGELPLELQPKLLRVLEAKTVRRLGDTQDRPVDVRFIAATHRNLLSMVSAGSFRQDLYFRVAVVRAKIPPLRERPADVPIVSELLLRKLKGPDAALSPAALSALAGYDWPGNVRELRNVIERATALAPSPYIEAKDLFGVEDRNPVEFRAAKEEVLARFERRYAEALLLRHQGNVSSAAREAGISRNALYAIMKRVGLLSSSE